MALDQERMAEIARPHATVSDRIRALAAAGAPRAEIARFLGKRYQHVRNVLEGDAQRGGYQIGRADLSGVREESARFDRADEAEFVERRGRGAFWLRLRPDGSVYLPKEVMEALQAGPDERVFASLDDGEFKIVGGKRAMDEALARIRKYLPAEGGAVDRFLAERPAMWERRPADDD